MTNLNELLITTNYHCVDRFPFWSPGGTKIVFESSRDSNKKVYVIKLD
ncbi:MAG: hypothetical protein CL783_06930 [Chloroflexi bacterium]|nr:hypothetical protein [Chloroflexota bacterium]